MCTLPTCCEGGEKKRTPGTPQDHHLLLLLLSSVPSDTNCHLSVCLSVRPPATSTACKLCLLSVYSRRASLIALSVCSVPSVRPSSSLCLSLLSLLSGAAALTDWLRLSLSCPGSPAAVSRPSTHTQPAPFERLPSPPPPPPPFDAEPPAHWLTPGPMRAGALGASQVDLQRRMSVVCCYEKDSNRALVPAGGFQLLINVCSFCLINEVLLN